MPYTSRILTLAGCLAGLAAAQPTPASSQGLELGFRQGYDTNVLEIASAADSARIQAHYTRVTVAYEYESGGRPLSFLARPEARAKWYPQSSSGNQYGAELLLEVKNTWRNPARGARWFRKAITELRVEGGYERALFLKRQTREEFRTGAGIDETLAVTELPGRASAEGELSVRSDLTRAVTVEGGAIAGWTDYSDAAGSSLRSFDRLDSRELGAFLKTSVEVARGWEVGGRARWRDRVYPKREARDAEGEQVEGTTRHYWDWDLELATRLRAGALRNKLELDYRRRSDRFESYLSYDAWTAGDRVRVALGGRAGLELRYSYGQKAYDLYAPGGAPIRNRYHDARAQLSAEVVRGWRLVVGSDYERTLSNDPFLDFERLDLFGEVRIGR